MMIATCGCSCCSSSRRPHWPATPNQIPKFDSGFVFERANNEILVFGRDGSRAFTLTILAGIMTDVALAPDGTFAAGYVFLDQAGQRQGALAFLDGAGEITKTVVIGLSLRATFASARTATCGSTDGNTCRVTARNRTRTSCGSIRARAKSKAAISIAAWQTT
jgi:hypothetical protein